MTDWGDDEKKALEEIIPKLSDGRRAVRIMAVDAVAGRATCMRDQHRDASRWIEQTRTLRPDSHLARLAKRMEVSVLQVVGLAQHNSAAGLPRGGVATLGGAAKRAKTRSGVRIATLSPP